MTANEFELKIDTFFELVGIVLSDILQFLVVFMMYISPLLFILPIYSLTDLSGLVYDLSVAGVTLTAFGMTIWHWVSLASNE